jgi:molybdopterin-guanine dinucleotide biosynthesis protein B
VGEKKSGKTMILEKVVAELAKKKIRVGVIKHTGHGFTLDYAKTDSAKLKAAGAAKVAMLGHGEVAVYGSATPESGPDQLRDIYLSDLDVVLVEGFKQAHMPKVLIAVTKPIPSWAKEIGGVVAVVSKQKPGFDAKHFKPPATREIVNLIQWYIKTHRKKREVNIYLDGKKLQIKPFIKDFFLNTIVGMVGSLNDAKGAKQISISIDFPDGVSVPLPGE